MAACPTLAGLDPPARRLASECLDWCDQWWDDTRGLPWGPPGHEAVGTPRSLHLMPQAGWYAVGLFLRDQAGDRERAERIIGAVCELQYDEPGTDWHGSYPIMAETPHPPVRATMWEDYDPNWRQFLGLSWVLLLCLFGDDLTPPVRSMLERAVRLGVEGEPPDRCPPSYTNIALKRMAFESVAGGLLERPEWVERAERLTQAVVELHDGFGAFEEFNSPTYAGVDLFALAIGRRLSPSTLVREASGRLEAALWSTIGRLYHPGLRNLCAPWTRTYGMDMQSYVAKVGLSLLASAPDVAPTPGWAADTPHGHDWFAGPVTALVGTSVPSDARDLLVDRRPRLVEQRISAERSATAWLGEAAMAGAEACSSDLSWWDQYVAAALHWETPPGGVGWVSVRMPGPSTASAAEGRLDVPAAGATEGATVVAGGCHEVPEPSGGRWVLPGLTLEISTALEPAGPGPFGGTAFRAGPGEDVHLLLA